MIRSVLPPSLTHDYRRFTFFTVAGHLFGGVLVVQQGKKRAVYAIAETTTDRFGARMFHVKKCGSADVYEVVVNDGFEFCPFDCSCTGFGRWGNCVHHDCLHKLVNVHQIPEIT